jgi:hypothetical protein
VIDFHAGTRIYIAESYAASVASSPLLSLWAAFFDRIP